LNLKEKIKNNELLLGSFIFLFEPTIVEILGKVGFDFVIIDMEHSAIDFKDVLSLVIAGDSAGISTIVRVSENNPKLILKALETGTSGICIPHTKTVEDAKLTINSAKYFPFGDRGVCGISRAACYSFCPLGEHFKSTNENLVIMVLIEDVDGIQNINEIISLEDIDIAIIGPDDLSGSLGLTISKEKDKKILDEVVLNTINKVSVDNKKKLGMFTPNAEEANKWISKGINNLIFSDIVMFLESSKNIINNITMKKNIENNVEKFNSSFLSRNITLDELDTKNLVSTISEKILRELEKYK